MNHVITVGEVLRALGGLIGVVVALLGLVMVFAGGMSDAPEVGDSAARSGCGIGLVGILIVVACFLLSGCGDRNSGVPAVPSDRVVEVKVPVAIQSVKPADVPVVPAPLGPRPATVRQQEDALLAKVCEFVAYALLADPLLRVSAGEKAQPLGRYPECERHP